MLCHLYTAFKYTIEKKIQQRQKRFDEITKMEKIHALFPWEKNIRFNFEIGFAVERKSRILTGKTHGEI